MTTELGTLRKYILKSYDTAKSLSEKIKVAQSAYRLGLTDLAFNLCTDMCSEGKAENKKIFELIYHQQNLN